MFLDSAFLALGSFQWDALYHVPVLNGTLCRPDFNGSNGNDRGDGFCRVAGSKAQFLLKTGNNAFFFFSSVELIRIHKTEMGHVWGIRLAFGKDLPGQGVGRQNFRSGLHGGIHALEKGVSETNGLDLAGIFLQLGRQLFGSLDHVLDEYLEWYE